MKKILCLFALMFAFSLISCGDSGSNDTNNPATPDNPKPNNSSEKFGITGISLSIGSKSAPAHIIMKDSPDEGAYVTWETWIENSIWTLPYQPGSYTAWDIQTPVTDGNNIAQIVGLAQTVVFTDIENGDKRTGAYFGYYGSDYIYLAVRGTLHLTDGTTQTSEYREAIPFTDEIRNYINYDVLGKLPSDITDRMSLTLHFNVNP